MYARVVTTEVQTGRMNEAVSIYSDMVTGAKEKGFKGALLLTDQANDKSISITLWESEADMLATEESGWWRQQVARFDDVFTGPPVREHYEVSFQA